MARAAVLLLIFMAVFCALMPSTDASPTRLRRRGRCRAKSSSSVAVPATTQNAATLAVNSSPSVSVPPSPTFHSTEQPKPSPPLAPTTEPPKPSPPVIVQPKPSPSSVPPPPPPPPPQPSKPTQPATKEAEPSTQPKSSPTSAPAAPPPPPPPPPPPASSPAPAPPASPPSDSQTSSSDIQAYLNAHNTIRAQHGASPLTWSDTAAAKAQQWANNCVFQHSGGTLGPFGENLAAGTGSSYGISEAVKSWTDEVSEYDPNNPQPSHFTQVVWKKSTQVGCAVQTCNGIFAASFGPAKFFVCEYSPQGNIIGQFAENVQV
ncbi:PR-1-like protein [Trametopsis cervina]|nr:PR-1-like protein [Trametopsis cervina]